MPRFEPSLSRTTPDLAADAGLRAEHRKLRRVFAALLAAIAPAAAMAACSEGPPQEGPGGAGTTTGTGTGGTTIGTGADGGPDTALGMDGDAGPDPADADAAPDAPKKSCIMKVTTFDSGMPGDPGCIYKLPCGLTTGLVVKGCDLYSEPDIPLNCKVEEGYGCLADAYAPGPDDEVHIICPDCLGGGRRPAGLARARAAQAPTARGAYFARMAHEEGASVVAFERMREELARLGAPASLQRAAARAARDEVRHARAMARCARADGAAVPAVRVRRSAPRSIEAIARENAVEGCVNETFGALVAAWQAAHAPDAALRRTFARIAADEARHAALSWAVARWIEGRLPPPERARLAAARARAVRALARRGRRREAGARDAGVGLPPPCTIAALLKGMSDDLGLV